VISHGQINRRIIVIVSQEPLIDRVSLEFKVSNDVILDALGVGGDVPDLIESCPHMR
jgi:hypothetical protein